jgi:hypothetical protein
MLNLFDIPYALRQTAVVAAIVVMPFLVYATLSDRRTRWQVGVGSVVVWQTLFAIVLWVSSRVWSPGDLPFRPLAVGPSHLSLFDIARVVAVTIWAPAAILFTVIHWRRRRRLVTHAAGGWVLLVMVGATCWTGLFIGAAGYAHEDTIYTPGFSLRRWHQVRDGMTRDEVVHLLGQPLPEHLQPLFAREAGALCWVRNWSAGHFAAVWFDEGKVARAQLWYSD